jgi:type IV pilus biogenesis protein CpaD/CtpE
VLGNFSTLKIAKVWKLVYDVSVSNSAAAIRVSNKYGTSKTTQVLRAWENLMTFNHSTRSHNSDSHNLNRQKLFCKS